MTATIRNQITEIESDLGQSIERWKLTLESLGIESETTPNGLILICPKCHSKNLTLRIWKRRGHAKWQCSCSYVKAYKKDAGGLIQLFNSSLSATDAIDKFSLAVEKPLGKAPDIKIKFGKYCGKQMSDVPISYLKWCLAEQLGSQEFRDSIVSYLYLPPTQ
jgi:hypothetical protein